jgi:hypothetical protein
MTTNRITTQAAAIVKLMGATKFFIIGYFRSNPAMEAHT